MRKKLRAWQFEGDPSVGGTDDPVVAANYLEAVGVEDWDEYYGEYHRKYEGLDPQKAYVSWMRVIPGCPDWCGEDHKFHYYDARPGARGAFPVVEWFGHRMTGVVTRGPWEQGAAS